MWDIQNKRINAEVHFRPVAFNKRKKLTITPEDNGSETVCQLCQESGNAH